MRSHSDALAYLAAFAIPFCFRLAPELISWPYPLGAEPLGYYVPAALYWVNPNTASLPTDAIGIMRQGLLFYVLIAAAYRFLVHDAFLLVKFTGPFLTGLLALSMFVYSHKALKWSHAISLVAALLGALYFVGLRISMDLQRNMLGLVFLFACLTAASYANNWRLKLATLAFAFLVLISHPITSAILVVALLAETLIRFRARVNAAWLAAAGMVVFLLFIVQNEELLWFSLAAAGHDTDVFVFSFMLGFLVYCFVPILPLVVLGWREARSSHLLVWSAVCLLAMGLSGDYWFRWALVLTYPLSLYAAAGLRRAIGDQHSTNLPSLPLKASGVLLVAIIVTMSVTYAVTAPETPFPYYSQYNMYLTFIPSSMLQNSVSIKDTPYLIDAIERARPMLNDSSALVLEEAVYIWAIARIGMLPNIIKGSRNLTLLQSVAQSQVDAGRVVYTIWWSNREGWYGISGLPASFEVVHDNGTFGIYLFNPS